MLVQNKVNGWVYLFDGAHLHAVGHDTYVQMLNKIPLVPLDGPAFNRMAVAYPIVNTPAL